MITQNDGPDRKRYVVLPEYGFRSNVLAEAAKLRDVGTTIRVLAHAGRQSAAATEVRVIHSTHEDGPKLVEMTPEAELNLRLEIPGLKIIPVIRYKQMKSTPRLDRTATIPSKSDVRLRVIDAATRRPIFRARILAFTNYRNREGVEEFTTKNGTAKLPLKLGTKLDRIYVFGPPGYWGYFALGVELPNIQDIRIAPIDFSDPALLLNKLYPSIPDKAGAKIVVGVVDTGIAQSHPALPNVTGGVNMVTDETSSNPGADADWGPAKVDGEHGTHVAGIIGMRALPQAPIRGVAPGVCLRSYRVFPHKGEGATNYDVMAAIDRGVRDGCHILNLSLGSVVPDEAVRAAIGDALNNGVLVVAAAGNDGRRAVSYPAAWPLSVAVSAMGRKGSFPSESTETSDVAPPYGTSDREAFVAAFTNMGPQISLTGPGVGIISTLPDDTYGPMSGTSMACPAIAGFAAHLLSVDAKISATTGDTRSRLLREALCEKAKPLGFGRDYEGFGLLSAPGNEI
jgi:subtilisin